MHETIQPYKVNQQLRKCTQIIYKKYLQCQKGQQQTHNSLTQDIKNKIN